MVRDDSFCIYTLTDIDISLEIRVNLHKIRSEEVIDKINYLSVNCPLRRKFMIIERKHTALK